MIVVPAAMYLTWAEGSEKQFDEFVARLRGDGEPVDPQDMVHPPIPAEDDAAPDLLAAAAALDKKSPALEAFGKIEFDGPLGAADRATIAKLVEGERDVLEKVRGARGKRDADWRIPYQSPTLMTLLPHLNDQRTLANMSRAAAIHERLRGNDAAALEHLRDTLAIGDATDVQPIMVGHLVATGVRAVGLYELARMAPDLNVGSSTGAATPEQVRATIRELLDETRSEAGFVGALRGERVMQLDTAKLLADRKLDINTLSGAPARRGSPPIPVPRGLVLTDARLMGQFVSDIITAYKKSPDYPSFRQNQPPIPAPIKSNPKIHFFAAIMLPSYDRYVQTHYRSKAERRLTAVALALRLYSLDHGGQFPKTLDELVPAYLPAVPKDPLVAGDKPLTLAVGDDGTPIVYSVGEDGKDDGGSLTPTRSRRGAGAPGRWETLDAVLPMKPAVLVKSKEEEEKDAKKAADE